jgi:hypothetical protein
MFYTDRPFRLSHTHIIIEIKDTSTGRPAACSTGGYNPVQRIYLAQVLYYMAIAEKKRRRQNTCDINYSSKQLMIWHHNDNDGRG